MIGFTTMIVATALISWILFLSGVVLGYFMGRGTFFGRCADSVKSGAMCSIYEKPYDAQLLQKAVRCADFTKSGQNLIFEPGWQYRLDW